MEKGAMPSFTAEADGKRSFNRLSAKMCMLERDTIPPIIPEGENGSIQDWVIFNFHDYGWVQVAS